MGLGRDEVTPRGMCGNPWFWLGALIVLSCVRFLVAANHALFETECYYWMYGKNVGFGYFDHPPMVGYFVRFFHFWEPPSSLAGRFPAVGLHFFCSIFLYYYSRNIFQSAQVGIRTVILFNVIPIYSILAYRNQPDSPLLFFWCATLLCYERSLSTGKESSSSGIPFHPHRT